MEVNTYLVSADQSGLCSTVPNESQTSQTIYMTILNNSILVYKEYGSGTVSRF
jgi:hypothetical protein